MSRTLTIRLDPEDRAVLEEAARGQGKGLSAYVRGLAEAQARRLRSETIRADGDRVMAYLRSHREAAEELDEIGTPQVDLS